MIAVLRAACVMTPRKLAKMTSDSPLQSVKLLCALQKPAMQKHSSAYWSAEEAVHHPLLIGCAGFIVKKVLSGPIQHLPTAEILQGHKKTHLGMIWF